MLEQDFMKEVLNRFDKIDSKLDEHSKEFVKVNASLDEHSKEFKKVNAKLVENSKELERQAKELERQAKLIEHNSELIKLNSKKIADNSLEIAGLTEVVTSHNNTLIRFEHEFNEKFNALFDSFSVNQDKHTEYEDSLDVLNSKVFNHDIRISVLEDTCSKKIAQA